MDSDVLAEILNDKTPEPVVQDPVQTEEPVVQTEVQEKPPVQVPTDPDLQWDDDDDVPEPPDKAPDELVDADLQAIEEKNKWMKGRLAPVKEKLTKAEQELERLRQENEVLKSGRAPATEAPTAPQPTTVDEYVNSHPAVKELSEKLAALKEQADKGEITEGDYVDQRTDILTDVKVIKRDIVNSIRANQAQQQYAVQQQEAKIEKDFQEAVFSKKEEYPEIDKAYNRVLKNAQHLDINIRASLILDPTGSKVNEDVGDLVNIIGNDKEAMGYLIAQSKIAAKTGRVPVQALEYLGRLKARVAAEKAAAESSEPPDVDAQVTRVRKPGLPRVIRATPNNDGVADLSSWAKAAVKAGQRPW